MKKYLSIAILLFSFSSTANESADLKPCRLSDAPTYDAACVEEAYLKADEKLNQAYQRLLATLDAPVKRGVRQKQREWIKKSNKICKIDADDEDENLCLLTETEKQTGLLIAKEAFYRAVAANTFTGNWQSCFHIEERDVDYCVGLGLIQEGDQIRGFREEFVSYRIYEIEVMGRVDTKKNIVYLIELGEGDGREFMFKLCDGDKIYYLENEATSCSALAKNKLNEPYERMLDDQP